MAEYSVGDKVMRRSTQNSNPAAVGRVVAIFKWGVQVAFPARYLNGNNETKYDMAFKQVLPFSETLLARRKALIQKRHARFEQKYMSNRS